MIVPCDELVDATMKSKGPEGDERNVGVQHAFWVPEWGMKEDFVPGLEAGTTLYFMPDDAGTLSNPLCRILWIATLCHDWSSPSRCSGRNNV